MLVAADEPGSGIDDQQVAGNVLTMLLAGEDTTANSLAWMLYLMWQNPATLARAVAEVQRVVGDSSPGMEQLAQLDFVEACAFEAMRLKPVAPLLPLQTRREMVIGDVLVPQGINVSSVMRLDSVSESHVPNASAFQPERWLVGGDTAAAVAASVKRVAMPFGAGPRMCPGRYLALLEIKLAIATVLRDFEITDIGTADGSPAQERLQFTMAPEGLRMRLRAKGRAAAKA
jgi:cytochrome P450